MTSDFEKLARDLLGGTKIPQNLDKFQNILSTPEGKQILSALMSDGGTAVKRAAADAQNGNMDSARQILNSIMSTREGANLVSQIVKAAGEK